MNVHVGDSALRIMKHRDLSVSALDQVAQFVHVVSERWGQEDWVREQCARALGSLDEVGEGMVALLMDLQGQVRQFETQQQTLRDKDDEQAALLSRLNDTVAEHTELCRLVRHVEKSMFANQAPTNSNGVKESIPERLKRAAEEYAVLRAGVGNAQGMLIEMREEIDALKEQKTELMAKNNSLTQLLEQETQKRTALEHVYETERHNFQKLHGMYETELRSLYDHEREKRANSGEAAKVKEFQSLYFGERQKVEVLQELYDSMRLIMSQQQEKEKNADAVAQQIVQQKEEAERLKLMFEIEKESRQELEKATSTVINDLKDKVDELQSSLDKEQNAKMDLESNAAQLIAQQRKHVLRIEELQRMYDEEKALHLESFERAKALREADQELTAQHLQQIETLQGLYDRESGALEEARERDRKTKMESAQKLEAMAEQCEAEKIAKSAIELRERQLRLDLEFQVGQARREGAENVEVVRREAREQMERVRAESQELIDRLNRERVDQMRKEADKRIEQVRMEHDEHVRVLKRTHEAEKERLRMEQRAAQDEVKSMSSLVQEEKARLLESEKLVADVQAALSAEKQRKAQLLVQVQGSDDSSRQMHTALEEAVQRLQCTVSAAVSQAIRVQNDMLQREVGAYMSLTGARPWNPVFRYDSSDQKQDVGVLQSQKAELQRDNVELVRRLEECISQYKALAEEAASLRRQCASSGGVAGADPAGDGGPAARSAVLDPEESKNEVEKLKNALAATRKDNEKLDAELASARKENERLTAGAASSRIEIEKLSASLDNFRSSMQPAGNLESTKTEVEKLKNALAATSKDKENLDAELASLKKEMERMSAYSKAEVSGVKAELASARRDHERVDGELAGAKKKIQELSLSRGKSSPEQSTPTRREEPFMGKPEVERLKNALAATRKDNEKLDAELASLKKEMERMSADSDEATVLRAAKDKHEREREEWSKVVAQLEKQRDDLQRAREEQERVRGELVQKHDALAVRLVQEIKKGRQSAGGDAAEASREHTADVEGSVEDVAALLAKDAEVAKQRDEFKRDNVDLVRRFKLLSEENGRLVLENARLTAETQLLKQMMEQAQAQVWMLSGELDRAHLQVRDLEGCSAEVRSLSKELDLTYAKLAQIDVLKGEVESLTVELDHAYTRGAEVNALKGELISLKAQLEVAIKDVQKNKNAETSDSGAGTTENSEEHKRLKDSNMQLLRELEQERLVVQHLKQELESYTGRDVGERNLLYNQVEQLATDCAVLKRELDKTNEKASKLAEQLLASRDETRSLSLRLERCKCSHALRIRVCAARGVPHCPVFVSVHVDGAIVIGKTNAASGPGTCTWGSSTGESFFGVVGSASRNLVFELWSEGAGVLGRSAVRLDEMKMNDIEAWLPLEKVGDGGGSERASILVSVHRELLPFGNKRTAVFEESQTLGAQHARQQSPEAQYAVLSRAVESREASHSPHVSHSPCEEGLMQDRGMRSQASVGLLLAKHGEEGGIRVKKMEPGGAAWESGKISLTDRLVSVNNVSVEGKELLDVWGMVSGVEGSLVKLMFEKEFNNKEHGPMVGQYSVTLKRSAKPQRPPNNTPSLSGSQPRKNSFSVVSNNVMMNLSPSNGLATPIGTSPELRPGRSPPSHSSPEVAHLPINAMGRYSPPQGSSPAPGSRQGSSPPPGRRQGSSPPPSNRQGSSPPPGSRASSARGSAPPTPPHPNARSPSQQGKQIVRGIWGPSTIEGNTSEWA